MKIDFENLKNVLFLIREPQYSYFKNCNNFRLKNAKNKKIITATKNLSYFSPSCCHHEKRTTFELSPA